MAGFGTKFQGHERKNELVLKVPSHHRTKGPCPLLLTVMKEGANDEMERFQKDSGW